MLKLRASLQDSSLATVSLYAINKNLMNKHTLIKHYLWHQNGRDKTYSENTKFKRILENWISDFQDEVRLQFKKQEKINCDRIIQRLSQQNYKNYKLPTHQ